MDHTAAAPSKFYDPVMRWIHWATLGLIMSTYGLIWLAHSGMAGSAYQPIVQLHRSFGLTIAALTVFRLVWRWRARIPPLPADLPRLQKLAARAAEGLIYGLLLLQPLLGLLHTGFRGQQVSLFLLGAVPPLVSPNRELAHLTHELHELGGNILLLMIGVHASAALYHHFIRRDEVLVSMLPALRQRTEPADGPLPAGDLTS